MSPIIAECEMHPNEEQLLQFNRDIFRHSGGIRPYILFSVFLFVLSLLFAFSSQWLLSIFFDLCILALLFYMNCSLRYFVRRMVKVSPHLLTPHRVMLTQDAVLELPLVGQLPPYTEVNCPYDKLNEVICTKEFYYFRYNMTSSCIFPRTLLTWEQEQSLCDKLWLCCGERFVLLS